MTTPTITPNVPLPAGALEVQDWKIEDGVTSRLFWGGRTADFEVEPEPGTARSGYRSFVEVNTAGVQWADGITKRWIEVDRRGLLTAQDAREMATGLLAAADEL